MPEIKASSDFAKHVVSGMRLEQVCMLIGVALGTTMKVMFPMFPKPAVAFPPACAAVAPSAMEAPEAPLPSDVHFAATVAGILACSKWDWKGYSWC